MYSLLKEAQPRVLRLLENSYKNNRLSHAYLFAGPKGTFKKEIAYHLAMMLYCKEDVPCYKCDDCQKILHNNHLNVTYIEPLGQTLKKEQIIALQQEYSKTSQIPGPRIYIINEADTMSPSAANSLLKFIEEPTSEDTYGILITENVSNILPTILSRTILVKFDSLNKDILANKLKDSFEDKLACLLVSETNNEADAVNLGNSPSFLAIYEVFKKFTLQLANDNPIGLFYHANEEVLSDKDNLKVFLRLICAFYRDTYEYLETGKILYLKAYEAEIKAFSEKTDKENLLKAISLILELDNKLAYNINISLFVNQLLIDLKGGSI